MDWVNLSKQKKDMLPRFYSWIFLLLAGQALQAQDARFFLDVSRDTLLAGHLVQLTYHIENADNKGFEPPEFKGFALVSGPRQSSSMQIMNGQVSRQATITYILASKEAGTFALEPARLTDGSRVLECPRKSITVLPNPGEIPDPQFPGYRPRPEPGKGPLDPRRELLRKGRKVYKM